MWVWLGCEVLGFLLWTFVLSCFMQKDILKSTSGIGRNVQQIGLRPIKHAFKFNLIRLKDSIASGTTIFNVCLDMEQVGTTLANHHQSIFAMAHLYNAAWQSKTLSVSWPVIEQLMQVQMVEPFAVQLPQKPKGLRSCFALRLGFSAQHFARNQRMSKFPSLKTTGKTGRPISHTQTLKILQDYISSREPMARCLLSAKSLDPR